jgi:hypothetical protein
MWKRAVATFRWAVGTKYVRRDDHGSYGHSLGYTNHSGYSSPIRSLHNIAQSALREVPHEAISSQLESETNHDINSIHASRRLNIEIQAIYSHKNSCVNLYVNSVATRSTRVITTRVQQSA